MSPTRPMTILAHIDAFMQLVSRFECGDNDLSRMNLET